MVLASMASMEVLQSMDVSERVEVWLKVLLGEWAVDVVQRTGCLARSGAESMSTDKATGMQGQKTLKKSSKESSRGSSQSQEFETMQLMGRAC
jgi:hypothetical protein